MTQYRTAVFATALLAALLGPARVAAEVFKCTNAEGVTTYQDIACKAGNTEERIDLSATTSSAEQSEAVRAATEALRKQDQALAERLQRESESRRELAARTPAPTYASPKASDVDYSRDSGYVWTPYQPSTGVWRNGVYYPPFYQRHTPPIANITGYRRNYYNDFRDSPYYNTMAGYPLPQAGANSRPQQPSSLGPSISHRPSPRGIASDEQ
jgi:Ni/Co efflux regulator RcnB